MADKKPKEFIVGKSGKGRSRLVDHMQDGVAVIEKIDLPPFGNGLFSKIQLREGGNTLTFNSWAAFSKHMDSRKSKK